MKISELQTVFSTRQFMLSEDFEMFYYSDQPISSVGPHTHDYYEFYFFLEGNICLHVEQKSYHIQPGDFIIIPPETSHYPEFLDSTTPYRRFILWVSRDYYETLIHTSSAYSYLISHIENYSDYLFKSATIQFNAIHSRLFLTLEEIRSDRFGRDAEVVLLINSLLLDLNRMIYEQNNTSKNQSGQMLYPAVCDYINSHLEEELSLERLANQFHVSKFYLSHSFTEGMGISLHQYLSKKRLQAVRDAILSGNFISKQYERYGFKDYTALFRSFKKEYGISPREFREQNLYKIR